MRVTSWLQRCIADPAHQDVFLLVYFRMGGGEGAEDLLVEERKGGVKLLDEHRDAALHAC